MTIFRLEFSYLVPSILRILHVELIAISDSGNFLTCELIKDSSGLTILSVIDVKF